MIVSWLRPTDNGSYWAVLAGQLKTWDGFSCNQIYPQQYKLVLIVTCLPNEVQHLHVARHWRGTVPIHLFHLPSQKFCFLANWCALIGWSWWSERETSFGLEDTVGRKVAFSPAREYASILANNFKHASTWYLWILQLYPCSSGAIEIFREVSVSAGSRFPCCVLLGLSWNTAGGGNCI